MNKFYQKDWETYYNFKIREDDIFVLSFPKSGKEYFLLPYQTFYLLFSFLILFRLLHLPNLKGTTWTQEMVWLVGNDCNFEGAKTLLRERVPFLE